MKKMTRAAYERTPIDKEEDRKGAKKAGVSLKKWEGSKADRKSDTKEMKRINVAKRKVSK